MRCVEFNKTDDGWWVDILRSGTWNPSKGGETTITEDDIDALVSSFNATKGVVKPVLRIGDHEDSNGAPKPAVGWVGDLRRAGDKLQAYFTDVPELVKDAIGKNLFRAVSAGLWRNYDVDGTKHPWLLNHVAILGAELPAVNGLEDLGAYMSGGVDVVVFTEADDEPPTSEGDDRMTIEELQKQVGALTERVGEVEGERDALRDENKKLVDERDALADQNGELTASRNRAEVEAVVDKAIADGRLLPKQKDATIAVGLSAKTASVEFKDGDEGSPFASWKAMLTDGGKVIDTDEKSKQMRADESESEDAAEADFKAGAEIARRQNKVYHGGE